MSSSPAAPVADLLVVDDVLANLRLLAGLLRRCGYKVRPAPSGAIALRAAAAAPPDLVLLDVNMPGLDGFEVCRRLRSLPGLEDVPVLFLSARDEVGDKLEAFRAGAVDYLSKPFHFEEVQARVQTHLELRRARRELAARYGELRRAEAMRDTLAHMIVHDLRSPLCGVRGMIELVEGSQRVQLPPEQREHLRLAHRTCTRLLEDISTLLDLGRLEAGRMPLDLAEHDLGRLVEEAWEVLGGLGTERRLERALPARPVRLRCDGALVRRVAHNLLANALRFSPREAPLVVRLEATEDRARLEVVDQGPGIPPEQRARIFDKYAQAEALAAEGRRYASGLGLAFCKLAVEAHGGRVGVESELGQGSTFWVELPLAPAG